jgi:hypothetical protein
MHYYPKGSALCMAMLRRFVHNLGVLLTMGSLIGELNGCNER